MPGPTRFPEYPSNFPSQQSTQGILQPSATEQERSASTSTSTLPPLEAEFLAELDFGATGGAGGGSLIDGDGIDWDALMNNGELFNSIGGGWNDAIWDDQSLR